MRLAVVILMHPRKTAAGFRVTKHAVNRVNASLQAVRGDLGRFFKRPAKIFHKLRGVRYGAFPTLLCRDAPRSCRECWIFHKCGNDRDLLFGAQYVCQPTQ